jgi:hypothetical protein
MDAVMESQDRGKKLGGNEHRARCAFGVSNSRSGDPESASEAVVSQSPENSTDAKVYIKTSKLSFQSFQTPISVIWSWGKTILFLKVPYVLRTSKLVCAIQHRSRGGHLLI